MRSPSSRHDELRGEKIRHALHWSRAADHPLSQHYYDAALGELAALLDELAAAEARAAELERERDEALAVRDGLISPVQKVLALKTELAVMRARAEKAEQALRELVTATTAWDGNLSSYCDGDDRTRVREALVAARDVLAVAAGDTGDTE